MKKESRILKNIFYAFAAQGISLVLSVLSSIILPMFLDKEVNYGYWSLFIFYTGYVGFFHFGLNDGVYQKAGGTEYEDMDKPLLGAQFRFGAIFQTVIGIFVSLFSVLFLDDEYKIFALIMTSVYMVLYNLTLYLGCIFQAANETRLYSLSVMIDKIVFMAALCFLFITKSGDFRVYVWFYMLAKVAAFVYCVYKGWEIVFSPSVKMNTTLREAFDSMKIGINLTIANIAGNLILGAGRFMIEAHWGIEAFGVFSFSLTITNFFLLFISQISMVLFPALRQIDEDKQKNLFDVARGILTVILPAIFIAYCPAKYILGLILPQYEESLRYMAILLPLCIFDGKMNMVCATYFKVLRKERFLLYVNLFSMFVSLLLCGLGTYLLQNMTLVVLFMVISVTVRYIVSEIYLERLMCGDDGGVRRRIDMASELIVVIIFTFICWNCDTLVAFIATIVLYILYLFINKNQTIRLIGIVKGKLHRI